ncbi:helix-turn-helix domain-containing protein [Paenibacillus polysaccharolyticus]|uniref:helix-turn-helix domain-containing protein n=1 Tax=Paenibacillus polysaccharolyticus TaxID=582692 RepID=UPI00203F7FA3|nr:helix-turn-helix domain-containing protein [Paenibacillus polysaccharolyticus]MCM3134271.1 helix-turn-helix domain-containing protein [Paenibacillus polysaccharolyticus]
MELNMTFNGLELWKASGGFANEPHMHDDWYQVTLPIRGQCLLVQEQQTYTLQAGFGIIAHPRTEHFFEIGSDAAVIVIKFRNLPRGLVDRGSRSVHSELQITQAFDPAEISRLFRGWHVTGLEDESDPLLIQETELSVEQYLERILSGPEHSHRAAREAGSIWSGSPEGLLLSGNNRPHFLGVNGSNLGIDPHMQRVLEYIHSDFTNPMDIDSMAAVAHQSRYHFMRSFKMLTGSTPYQYLLNLRVEEAVRCLRNTTESVTEISFALGFSHVSQFYRAFQRVKGVTPMQFRNQL